MLAPARPGLDRRSGPLVAGGAALAAGAALAGSAVLLGDPMPALTAVVGLGGAALVVWNRHWALAALAAFVVLNLADVATDFHGAPSLFQPLIGAILLGVAARGVLGGGRPALPARAVVLAGAYVLVAVASLLFAPAPGDPVGTALGLIKDAGVAVVAGLLVVRSSSLRTAARAVVACGGLLAAISVVQFLGGIDSSFAGLGQWSVENIVGTYDDVRISGPLGDPNFYGQLLVVVLPLALDRMWQERHRALRWASGGIAALVAAAAVFTFSRGAALAVAAVLVVMVVIHRPGLRAVAAVAIAAALAVPFLPPGYLDRLTTLADVGTVEGSTDVSIRGRTAEVTAAWLMFADRPLTGVGYGLYDENYQDYVGGLGIELRSEARDAHSLYLEVAAETGLPGIAAMGALILASFAGLRRGRRRFAALGRTEDARLTGALAASLIGFLITALFLHLDFARLFWLLVGVALAVPAVAEAEAGAAGPAGEAAR